MPELYIDDLYDVTRLLQHDDLLADNPRLLVFGEQIQ